MSKRSTSSENFGTIDTLTTITTHDRNSLTITTDDNDSIVTNDGYVNSKNGQDLKNSSEQLSDDINTISYFNVQSSEEDKEAELRQQEVRKRRKEVTLDLKDLENVDNRKLNDSQFTKNTLHLSLRGKKKRNVPTPKNFRPVHVDRLGTNKEEMTRRRYSTITTSTPRLNKWMSSSICDGYDSTVLLNEVDNSLSSLLPEETEGNEKNNSIQRKLNEKNFNAKSPISLNDFKWNKSGRNRLISKEKKKRILKSKEKHKDVLRPSLPTGLHDNTQQNSTSDTSSSSTIIDDMTKNDKYYVYVKRPMFSQTNFDHIYYSSSSSASSNSSTSSRKNLKKTNPPKRKKKRLKKNEKDESNKEVLNRLRATPKLKKETISDKLTKYYKESVRPSSNCCKSMWRNHLPILRWLSTYNMNEDLLNDIIAGLTVAIMQIPQGLAYALLAGVAPIYGLYSSFFPVIIYALLGTSHQNSIGTFAVVALMTGSAVDNALDENASEEEKIKVATAVALIAGTLQLLMGIIKLGFVSVYLSDPLISGFTSGAAVHVFTSQTKGLMGLNIPRYNGNFKLVRTWYEMIMNLHKSNIPTVLITLIAITLLALVKEQINKRFKHRLKMPIPIELIVVILSTIFCKVIDVDDYNIKILNEIPKGLPSPAFPPLQYFSDVFSDAITIAVIAYAVSYSLAAIFAKKHNYLVDPNQELIAYGSSNMFGSFFSCFPVSASMSRSLVQDNAGAKTQLSSLFSCFLLLLVLLVLGPYFETLPTATLSAIVMVALKGMFRQTLEVGRYWQVNRIEGATFIITYLATVILNVDTGLVIGLAFSFLVVIVRSQIAEASILGRIPNTDIYKNVNRYKKAEELNLIRICRFEDSLFFTNSQRFKNLMYEMAEANPQLILSNRNLQRQRTKQDVKRLIKKRSERLQKQVDVSRSFAENGESPQFYTLSRVEFSDMTEEEELQQIDIDYRLHKLETSFHHEDHSRIIKYLILDCSAINYIDSMGVKAILQLIVDFKKINIQFFLVACKSPLRNRLKRMEFNELAPKDIPCLFLTISDAVNYSMGKPIT
ncbi:hypothetical protein SNEBB_003457 [Seison nebaliae]|nr:hypothetical protein SNEBB_003457 [Seison nebaliae]